VTSCPKCKGERWWVVTDLWNRAQFECADCLHTADLPKPKAPEKGPKATNPWWNSTFPDSVLDHYTPPNYNTWWHASDPAKFEDDLTIRYYSSPEELAGEEWKRAAAKEKAEKIDRMRQDSRSVEAFLDSLEK